KEYLSVSKELGDIFPSLVERIGSKGEVHLKNVEAIDEEIKRVKELARLEDLSAIKNEEDVYKDGIKEADEIRRKLEEAEKMLSTARNTSENSNIGWSRERAEKTIPDLQSQIVYYDKLLSGFNSNLNNQVNEMSQKFLDMNNVIEGVALESANMYSALDFSNMNTSEISDARKMLDAFSIARSNAFENNDIVAFNSATKGMSQYLRDELGLTREEVRELVSHFSTFEEKMNNVSNSSELTAEAMRQLMMETDLTEQQIAELSGSFEELDNSLKESTDSIKNINGVLESYHENGSLTTEKMLELRHLSRVD